MGYTHTPMGTYMKEIGSIIFGMGWELTPTAPLR